MNGKTLWADKSSTTKFPRVGKILKVAVEWKLQVGIKFIYRVKLIPLFVNGQNFHYETFCKRKKFTTKNFFSRQTNSIIRHKTFLGWKLASAQTSSPQNFRELEFEWRGRSSVTKSNYLIPRKLFVAENLRIRLEKFDDEIKLSCPRKLFDSGKLCDWQKNIVDKFILQNFPWVSISSWENVRKLLEVKICESQTFLVTWKLPRQTL